ncbi:MAG: DNA-directed RNA polymerase subunit omega [Clostridia bacterium]|nr:DNA-directed RNA polymerase subunit omega [Clostridia bacterium]
MMLAPSMKDLLTHIDNRYMLVNIAAKRARDIATSAEEREVSLTEKPVTLALNDIIDGKVEVIPADVVAAMAEDAAAENFTAENA